MQDRGMHLPFVDSPGRYQAKGGLSPERIPLPTEKPEGPFFAIPLSAKAASFRAILSLSSKIETSLVASLWIQLFFKKLGINQIDCIQ